MSLSLTRTRPRTRWRSTAAPYRVVLLAVVATGAIAGFAVTGADASRDAVRNAGSELVHLLQMMALLKVGMAVGAAWLADWRLRQPVGQGLAAAYLAAAGLMAVGPGLIWDMAHVVLGAVLLHTGLAAMIVLACTDNGITWRIPGRR